MLRLGILGSTRGTHLTSLQHAIQQNLLNATIEIVISNKPNAVILERAQQLTLPTCHVDAQGLSREMYDAKISTLLKNKNVDLIILIGYMRILSAEFVNTWPNKIMNIHPSLLPAFAGKMDLALHEAVLASGVNETGCTVHYVTEEVDAGPILLQRKCAVLPTDTVTTLKERVQQLEGQALINAIQSLT